MPQTKEGQAVLYYPEGRISKRDEVFYNPTMRANRDISMLLADALTKIYDFKLNIIDAFSATGVRGIRYALECPATRKVVFNDLNPKALKYIERNIEANRLSVDYEIHGKDARVLFIEKRRKATLIDVDPFGTPAPYLDCVPEAAKRLCIVGITATDTAVLCGTYPKVAFRRYGARTMRFDAMHEQGVRILLSFISREFAKHDVGFVPIASLVDQHYIRIWGIVKRSTKEAERSIENANGYLNVCVNCGYRELSDSRKEKCDVCHSTLFSVHPVWNSKIFDKHACKLALNRCEHESEIYTSTTAALLSRMVEESELNCVFYDTHFLAKKYRLGCMKNIDGTIQELKNAGYEACRTHMKATAIRTNAPLETILKVLKG